MDVKCIIPKEEEPVEYFLISSISDEDNHSAVDAHSNGEYLSEESPLIQVVKQELCENEKPVYDGDYDDYETEEKPVDPLEFVKQESDKEISEYEPEDVDNETDDDWSAEIATRTKDKSSNIAEMKDEFKKRKISIIDDDEDIIIEGPPRRMPATFARSHFRLRKKAHRSIHKGKRLQCDMCRKVFRSKSHIFEHMKTHDEPKFSCPICSKAFPVKRSFVRHQIIHEEKAFQCEICKKLFRQKANISEHMKIHRERLRRFPCELCDMAYYEQRTLNRHMSNIHSNLQRKRFRCPNALCDKSYSSIGSFRLHACVDGRRPQDKLTTKCPLCDRVFGNRYELKRHTERTHDKPANYHCTECGKTFLHYFYDSFVQHVAQKCSKNTLYRCDYCSKTARTKQTLIEHFVSGHGFADSAKELPYCCPHCSKMYSLKKYLDNHVKTMHTNPQCEHCKRTFQSKWGLKKHQQFCMPKQTYDKYAKDVAVGGARQADAYACEICKRSFITETNLLEHRTEVHLNKNFELTINDKTYRCATCKRSFNDQSSLASHRVRMHSNKKNFKCSSCDRKFVDDAVYHVHLTNSECGRNAMPLYQCTVCSKIYTTNVRLRLHFTKIHTNGGEYFHCDICQRAYATKLGLRKHLEMGDHRSSWQCEFCSKTFSQISPYKTHVRHCKARQQIK